MNRHKKLALFIAPFLLLIGYIGGDYYADYQAQQHKVFQLVPEGHCDVINQHCVLTSGEFKINVFDEQGTTKINSTFPIDNAILFVVTGTQAQDVEMYQMAMTESPYYWQHQTPLSERLAVPGESQKLRVIVTIKGGQYISEFYSQTTK